MAQNNSVFVCKTSNCSRGRSNLRNNINQVKNLKSLRFTWILRLLYATQTSVVSLMLLLIPIFLQSSVLWYTVLQNQYNLNHLLKQMIHQHQPLEALCFHLSSLHLLYWGTVFPNSSVTDGCWFRSISSFAMFTKSTNDGTILFAAFSIFMIDWQPDIFTVLAN